MTKIIAGILLFLISVWGGSYGLSFSPTGEDWWAMPLFVTAFVGLVLSAGLFIQGMLDFGGDYRP